MELVPRSGDMGRLGGGAVGDPQGPAEGTSRECLIGVDEVSLWENFRVFPNRLQLAWRALTGECRMIGGFMEMYPSNSTFHGVDVIFFLVVVMMQCSKFSRFLENIFGFPSRG